MEKVVSGTSSSNYPIYDAHGNEVGQVQKFGANSYNASDQRAYDAWGSIRTGGTSGSPRSYCASLGHKQDDETGFIYMRARYYEPSTARFLSEDGICQGTNWFAYAGNKPGDNLDRTGTWSTSDTFEALGLALAAGAMYFLGSRTNYYGSPNCGVPRSAAGATAHAAFAVVAFSISLTLASFVDDSCKRDITYFAAVMVATRAFLPMIATMTTGAQFGSTSLAQFAVYSSFAYGLHFLGELVADSA